MGTARHEARGDGTQRRSKPARIARCLTALLAGFLFLPGQGLAGGIKGKVVLAGAAPAPRKIDVTIDQYVCGTEKEAADLLLSPRKEIGNAVVWLENPPSGAPWPARANKVEMDQKACVYVPRIVLVPAGGTVDFLNSDRLLHNIHAEPKDNVSFNRTQPKNRTISVTFAKPEIIKITCDLHAWMEAWVVVTAHPFYAVTGADGQFEFDNLPPGNYRLKVWQERLGMTSAQVTVGDRQPAPVTVEMKAP
ncbi:MAG TPA: carboxypeptidase regulatory-like domain-containing protein [Casimicrobiaceae bacterium]|nr:carboxypeptidase regulatory-like domain-containing protein [Casimicrobiaceae bacterium]